MNAAAKDMVRHAERAAALVEFALLLPFLLLVLGAIVDFSISGRYESAVIRALGAANRSVMASAGDEFNDDIACAEAAGREFLDTLQVYGGLHEAGFVHPGLSKPALMKLSVYPVPYLGPGLNDTSPDNKDPILITGSFTQRCYFCALTDSVMDMFSARLFQPQAKSALASVSQAGGCYPKNLSCASSAPGGAIIESSVWENSRREIVLDNEGGIWCCGGSSCSHVSSV